MTALQIRDVPENIHKLVVEAAQARGLSVQKYLLEIVTREASLEARRKNQQRFIREMVELPSLEIPLTSEEIVEMIHEGRREHDEQIWEAINDTDRTDN